MTRAWKQKRLNGKEACRDPEATTNEAVLRGSRGRQRAPSRTKSLNATRWICVTYPQGNGETGLRTCWFIEGSVSTSSDRRIMKWPIERSTSSCVIARPTVVVSIPAVADQDPRRSSCPQGAARRKAVGHGRESTTGGRSLTQAIDWTASQQARRATLGHDRRGLSTG